MRYLLFVVLGVLTLLAAVSLASAQSGERELGRFTVDGGGSSSVGDVYAVSGTIGQPGPGSLEGEIYTLLGGFWGVPASSEPVFAEVYLPLIQK